MASGGLHAEGQLEGGDAGGEAGVVGAGGFVVFIEGAKEVELLALGCWGEVGIVQVGDGFFEVGDEGALITGGEECGAPEGSALGRLAGAEDDEAGEVAAFAAEAVGEPGAETRAREGLFARVHLETCAVVIDIVGDHGADDAEVVGVAGEVGKQIADFEAGLAVAGEFEWRGEEVAGAGALELGHGEWEGLAGVRFEGGLGVEEVDVGGAAGHEEEDEILGARGEHGGARGEWVVGGGLIGGAGFVVEKIGEADETEAVGEVAECVAAGEGGHGVGSVGQRLPALASDERCGGGRKGRGRLGFECDRGVRSSRSG